MAHQMAYEKEGGPRPLDAGRRIHDRDFLRGLRASSTSHRGWCPPQGANTTVPGGPQLCHKIFGVVTKLATVPPSRRRTKCVDDDLEVAVGTALVLERVLDLRYRASASAIAVAESFNRGRQGSSRKRTAVQGLMAKPLSSLMPMSSPAAAAPARSRTRPGRSRGGSAPRGRLGRLEEHLHALLLEAVELRDDLLGLGFASSTN